MSNDYCCVPQCKSLRKRGPELSFHLFPKKGKQKVNFLTKLGVQLIDRQEAWIMRLKMGKKVTPRMVVCSLHFTEKDYYPGAEGKKNKHLKRDSVLSRNLPKRKHDKQIEQNHRTLRMRKREEMNALQQSNSEDDLHVEVDVEIEDKYSEEERGAAETLLNLLGEQPTYVGPKTFKDFQVQVNTPEKITVAHFEYIRFCCC